MGPPPEIKLVEGLQCENIIVAALLSKNLGARFWFDDDQFCNPLPACSLLPRLQLCVPGRMPLLQEDQNLELPNLVNTGLITGRQQLMTPKRDSKPVKSAIREYICCILSGWMSVVTHMRLRVTTQIL